MRLHIFCDDNRLSGYSKGKELYDRQLKGVLTYSYKVTLVFPRNVVGISLSFIDGLMSRVYENIEKNEVSKYIAIEGNDSVVNKFATYLIVF